jgi:hypothetical protein
MKSELQPHLRSTVVAHSILNVLIVIYLCDWNEWVVETRTRSLHSPALTMRDHLYAGEERGTDRGATLGATTGLWR